MSRLRRRCGCDAVASEALLHRLLVINPSTSQTTTDRLAQHMPHVFGADTQLTCITARFGASYIALRESAACPVTGLAEASFSEASAAGPFAIVTGGKRWGPMLQRMAQSLGFGAGLKRVETVRETGAVLLVNPEQVTKILAQACQRAATHDVKSIILGGAGLAGYAALVQPAINPPIIDSVLAGACSNGKRVTARRTQPLAFRRAMAEGAGRHAAPESLVNYR